LLVRRQRAFQAANGYVLATSPWSLQWRSAAAAAAASYQPRVPAAKNAHGYYGLSDQEALVEINALKEEGPGGPSDGLLSSLSETIEASMQSRQSSNFLALVSNVLQRYGAAVSSVSSLMESYVSSVSSARLTPLSGYTDGLSTISSLLSDVRSKSSVASVSSAALTDAAASAASLQTLSARLSRRSLWLSSRSQRISELSTAHGLLYAALSTSFSSASSAASDASASLSSALSDYSSVLSDIESSRSSTVSSLLSVVFPRARTDVRQPPTVVRATRPPGR